MKEFCLVLLLLPVSVLAQSVFDGTWKTNMSEAKISQKPIIFAVNNGMYTCDSCVPKIRDGKLYSIEKITVSAGGKQMTDVVDNKLTGRVSTYIAEKQ